MKPEIERMAEMWENCKRCVIGNFAFRHVFGWGSAPAPYLFVGEGPGVSEDALGMPFIGASGRLLRHELAACGFRKKDFFITNLVACRPTDKLGGPNRPPTELEIMKCAGRLKGIVGLVRPKIIVAVGMVASKVLDEQFSTFHIHTILHPAYILRNGGTRAPMYNDWVKEIFNLRKLKTKG